MLDEKVLFRDPQEKEIGAVIQIGDAKGKNRNSGKGNLSGRIVEVLERQNTLAAIDNASLRLTRK